MPPPSLAPFIATVYHARVSGTRGQAVQDWLHPESANLRITANARFHAGIGAEPMERVPDAAMSGPTSRATHFSHSPGRTWGIGLLPLGWARFVRAEAALYADRIVDVRRDPAFASLARMENNLFRADQNLALEAAALFDRLSRALGKPAEDEGRILAIHQALVEGRLASVSDMAKACNISQRTLERSCRRSFGFTPQVLLRRQRFLRSLARFMVDPDLDWTGSIDEHYYDQAQFVRDFRCFMTMTPSEYAALDKPILTVAVKARLAAIGQPLQMLHPPRSPD